MPNIMKIRQCFLELRLKMLGMFFFETHCITHIQCHMSTAGVGSKLKWRVAFFGGVISEK